jgi:large subunit ribosomal protein L15
MKLLRIVKKPKRRIGRGHGSGRVKTSGRGTKGQKARGTVRFGFEGGQLPLIKRVPFLRGKGRNASEKKTVLPLDVKVLNSLPKGTVVTLEVLKKHGMIDESTRSVKFLGKGPVEVIVTVQLSCSQSAAAAITKAGGVVGSK